MVHVQPAHEQDELDEMAWIKKDDSKYRSREYRALSDAAYRLYDQALCFCNDQLTDGVILRDDLEVVKVGIKSSRLTDHAEELCIQGLWHQPGDTCASEDCPLSRGVRISGGWVVHDYFDLRPTREEVLYRKRVYEERAQKAGLASGASRRTSTPTKAELTSSRQADSVADLEPNLPRTPGEPIKEKETKGVGKPKGNEDPRSLPGTAPSPPSPSDPADPVQLVYDTWLASLKPGTRRDFSEARRRAIRGALKRAPLADCLDAVRGWRYDDWQRRPWVNDLEDCLRPSNLENFRDWQRGINRPGDVLALPTARPHRASRIDQVDAEAGASWPTDEADGLAP